MNGEKVYIESCNCSIDIKHKEEVISILQKLHDTDCDNIYNLMELSNYPIKIEHSDFDNRHYIYINYLEDIYYNEKTEERFFNSLAHLMFCGSYIEFKDTYNGHWRYYFEDNKMTIQVPEMEWVNI